jgi:MinD-like ATPase involved in chromosome partitioning or flagellar assembly
MIETELALARSARSWSDDLHRFLADHGGARVRVTAMDPEDLFGEMFDVLLIDDICSFLTPRLVELVKAGGREVVGVYDPAEFADGKDRLLECGVADVVEAGAHPDEFLRVIARVAQTVVTTELVVSDRQEAAPKTPERRSQTVLAVGGPAGGTGTTEVAIGIAARLGDAGRRVVLIDCDETNPSIAQRLGMPIHPNIRTAIDMLQHRTGPVTGAMHLVGPVAVITGLPNVTDWSEVRPSHVVDLVVELSSLFDHVVVNVGSHIEALGLAAPNERFGMSRRLIEIADRVIAVGLPSPVGVARTLRWIAEVDLLTAGAPIDVLINRAPRDQFRRGELVEEITRTYQPASLAFIPTDDVVERAAWDGTLVARGRFRKALDRWVDRFVPAVVA